MSRYTVINISKRDFSVFINARIRPFLQIRSQMNTTIAISLLDRATHHIIGRNDPENELGDPGRVNSKFSRPTELNNTVESRDPS